MDADAAGILGLLLGGAGGYYGGKKRAEREASDLEKLIAMYSGKTDEDITEIDSQIKQEKESGQIEGEDEEDQLTTMYRGKDIFAPYGGIDQLSADAIAGKLK